MLIAGAEFTLLRRSGFTLALGVVLPVALGLLILWAEADTGRAGQGAAVGLLLATLMALTAYVSATTTLAARRQQSVLRQLRHSGASDSAILTGTLMPSAILSVTQTMVLLGVVAVADGLGGVTAAPLVLAVVAGTAVACAFAALTAAFTSAPELAQLTTTPVALAFLGGALWTAQTPPGEVTGMMLMLPGAAVTQLARIAWQEPGAAGLLPALVPLVLSALVAAATASRVFHLGPAPLIMSAAQHQPPDRDRRPTAGDRRSAPASSAATPANCRAAKSRTWRGPQRQDQSPGHGEGNQDREQIRMNQREQGLRRPGRRQPMEALEDQGPEPTDPSEMIPVRRAYPAGLVTPPTSQVCDPPSAAVGPLADRQALVPRPPGLDTRPVDQAEAASFCFLLRPGTVSIDPRQMSQPIMADAPSK